MSTTSDLAAMLRDLPSQARANLAVELIDSLGERDWDEATLSTLAEEREQELESGAVTELSYDEFVAGIRRVKQD